MVQAFKTKQR